nr:hypothetical protein [uncultured Roseateles sp.]
MAEVQLRAVGLQKAGCGNTLEAAVARIQVRQIKGLAGVRNTAVHVGQSQLAAQLQILTNHQLVKNAVKQRRLAEKLRAVQALMLQILAV